jgi:tRNA pseudouridine55 synthase
MIGTLLIDKPAGMTSHDVVARVRRAARTRRVGHAGTLDPFATGVLVVCLGRATRLMQYLVGLDKEYLATVRLGVATDTQDLTGILITRLQSSKELSLESVQQVLSEFTGPQLQVPPMFSAKKVDGERLYHAARAGREVERPPVSITVYEIETSEMGEMNADGTRDFMMRVRCSSGTYVRTLAHDIGSRLGVGAHLAALRRTAVGRLQIENALTLDNIEQCERDSELEQLLLSPSDTLAHLPLVQLDENAIKRVMNGREITKPSVVDWSQIADGPVRLCDESGALVAIGELDAERLTIHPRVVLAGEE